jgi:hypothetical protein
MSQVDEAELRTRMRDVRYWNRSHPEASAWRAGVDAGWRALAVQEKAAGDVHVKSYKRQQHGKAITVSAHVRGDPPGGEPTNDGGVSGEIGADDLPGVPQTMEAAYRRRRRCEDQLANDQRICRALRVPAVVKEGCWVSAMERYRQ